MKYCCTRNSSERVTAAQAIAQGISADGGLFVPESLPVYTYDDLTALSLSSYTERAAKILSDFLPEFTAEELLECAQAAYASEKFSGDSPAPLTLQQNGNRNMYVLELWHGPTCAFKDMALQMLPHLLTRSLQKNGDNRTAVILVATSGDTGKAALEGFRDVPGTKILVFYPENGVSEMQKRQMQVQEGQNVSVCAIQGNFDDAQTGVKRIFTDPAVKAELQKHGMMFSSANSINWGRLLPQIVYYFSAYCDLMRTGEMDHPGEKINIVVPTGNFGNILAAFYAKQMGLPVNRLICASNENNVLTDFLRTGVYDRNRPFHTTISPSMDILVSSNLERLLFHLTDGDSARVAGWMKSLNDTGRYEVDAQTLAKLRDLFWAGYCDDAATKNTIREMFQVENYLCDPHTAVAVHVYQQYTETTGDLSTPTVVVSTASPYKFAPSVLEAVSGQVSACDDFARVEELSALTGAPVPQPILSLRGKPVRFTQSCAKEQMAQTVLSLLV